MSTNGIKKILNLKFFNEVVISLVFLFFPIYVFLNAHNAHYADYVLAGFFLLIIPRALQQPLPGKTRDYSALVMLWGYGVLAIASLLFPPSQYVDHFWFLKAFSRIVLGFLIIWAIANISSREIALIRWIIAASSIFISIAILLHFNSILDKHALKFLTFFPVIAADNNDKIYSFWLLFAIWSTVALFMKKGAVKSTISIICYVLGTLAIFSSTSESAKLALVLSTVVFFLCFIPAKKFKKELYFSLFLLFILLPLLWVIVSPIKPNNPDSILYSNWAIGARIHLYDFCATLVSEKLITGYGFGSTLNIPIPAGGLPGWAEFPGGHPHNISFLLFVEFGIFGLFYLVGVLLMWFKFLFNRVSGTKQEPAVWALAFSGAIVYSLSFSVWVPDVVLSYLMFFTLLTLAAKSTETTKHLVENRLGEKIIFSTSVFGSMIIILNGTIGV